MRKKGYGGLLESGVIKMLQGLTTAEEVLGVTFSEDIGDVGVEQEGQTVVISETPEK